MLGDTKGQTFLKQVKDYVVFDLETTGISCIKDDIIEVSALKVRDGVIVEEFSELVNPGRPIPPAASQVNNITDSMVAGCQSIEEVLPRFMDFIGDDILIGHNINSFDMKFLYRDCEKFYGKVLTNDTIDTLRLAKAVFPEWHHRRLSDLAEFYGLSTEGAHRALADCKMNQIIYENMAVAMTENAPDKASVKCCPECGQIMVRRNGKFGAFWGCGGYPDCKHTENV